MHCTMQTIAIHAIQMESQTYLTGSSNMSHNVIKIKHLSFRHLISFKLTHGISLKWLPLKRILRSEVYMKTEKAAFEDIHLKVVQLSK